jgi:hypothetical protein
VELSPVDHIGRLSGISLSEPQREVKGALNKARLREQAFCASHMSKIDILGDASLFRPVNFYISPIAPTIPRNVKIDETRTRSGAAR